MAKVGVVLAHISKPARDTKVLVLEGVKTADRPAAIGYFLLNIMREWYARFREFPHVDLQLGRVEAADIMGLERRTSTELTEDWYGRIYELTLAVERDDRDILDPRKPGKSPEPEPE